MPLRIVKTFVRWEYHFRYRTAVAFCHWKYIATTYSNDRILRSKQQLSGAY
jgi:hypothetical protein